MNILLVSSEYYLQQIASLLLYQSVLDNPVGKAYINLLQNIYSYSSQNQRITKIECLQSYGVWFKALAKINLSWQDYIIQQIIFDSNPFSQQIQTKAIEEISPSLLAAAKHDLQILQEIYNCSNEKITTWIKSISQESENIIVWEAEPSNITFLHQAEDWGNLISEIADCYRQHGTGIFARYTAFKWQDRLVGISQPDPIKLSEIVGYEYQKETLIKNTKFLLAGYPALHTLLYGSRGTGKSSLVKALLTEYSSKGLRIIEVSKSELDTLPTIVEQLRNIPQKFIIFVDDLSFEEDNDAFKALKVVLEGNITATAKNIVVYATTNRRHLIREYFGDRPRPSDSDEIHNWDTVEEKLSFSDRFGITLTFEPANQDTYLKIVNHLAKQAQISLPQKEIEFKAKQWATRKNGQSGRTAKQFINYIKADIATI